MKNLLFILLTICLSATVFGQDTLSTKNKYYAEVKLAPTITSDISVPFWMRSMQYGSIPSSGVSGNIVAGFFRDYEQKQKIWDWGAGFEGRFNGGKDAHMTLIEGYLKGKFSIFQLKIGRSKDFDGLVDSTLTTGSFSLSGNALGIPKIQLGIPQYVSIPFTKGLLAFKGNISHGWMGNVGIQYGDYSGQRLKSYYHHLSAYGRLGRPDWRLKFYAAINHDVIWGSDDKIFGTQYNLSWANAFFHVLTGKAYTPPKSFKGTVDISKIGNHQGSFDFGGDYEFRKYKLHFYHQFFYDKGALGYLANLKDGLTGISFTNKVSRTNTFSISKVLFEFFYSKDQAGEYGARYTPSGPEYYYNHAVYTEGFSYRGISLGTSLFTPASLALPGQISDPLNYFINNRVIAINLGVEGRLKKVEVTLKNTFSRNYGDYRTSGPNEQWYNGNRVKQDFYYGKFKPVNQFSSYLKCIYPIKERYRVGFEVATDIGQLLPDSFGGMITLTRHW